MTERWGGLGRHARRPGALFDPRWAFMTVAIAVWLTVMARQRLCETTRDGHPVNAYLRLCHSDLPILYRSHLAGGQSPYASGDGFDQAPLVVIASGIVRMVVAIGHTVRPRVGGQPALDASNAFLAIFAIVFGACFLVMVRSQLAIRQLVGSPDAAVDPRRRAPGLGWTLVAVCLTAFTAGMISWELLGAALMAAALWAWYAQRWLAVGIFTGLAIAANGFLLPLVLVFLAVAVGRGEGRRWPVLVGVPVGIVVALNLPFAALDSAGWSAWVKRVFTPDLALGHLWDLVLPDGPARVVVARALVALAWFVVIALVTLSAARVLRPRPEQLMLLCLGTLLVMSPTYSPQQAVLMIGLVALARPGPWAFAFAAVEALYWACVFAYLNGSLRFVEQGGETPYGVVILLRVGMEVVIMGQVLADVWRASAERGRASDGRGRA